MSTPIVLDSHDLAEVIDSHLPSAPVSVATGQIVDVTGGAVTVNLGGLDRLAANLLAIPVRVGDNVLLLRQGNLLMLLGPRTGTALPDTGTVASVPANTYSIIVTTAIGSLACGFVAAYTPTVADTVLIDWHGTTPRVIGKQGKLGTPPAPAPPSRPSTPGGPPGKAPAGVATFVALSCQTRSDTGWSVSTGGTVAQGAPPGGGASTGAWFYGGKIAATLRGATATAASIWLGRTQGGAGGPQVAHLYRVTNDARPAGTLAFTGTTFDAALEVGQRGWFPLPLGFAQELIDSGGSVGVQAPTGPYLRLFGLPQSGMAGAVRIHWQKG